MNQSEPILAAFGSAGANSSQQATLGFGTMALACLLEQERSPALPRRRPSNPVQPTCGRAALIFLRGPVR